MATVVVFDCESDRLFDKSRRPVSERRADYERRRDEISAMECTVACGLVLPVAAVHRIHAFLSSCSESGASEADALIDELLECGENHIVCWRDCAGTFDRLLRAFDDASVIVGYNQMHFDMPLLRKYYGRNVGRYQSHLTKCMDPFVTVRAITSEWIALDALLSLNGLPAKTGVGGDAVKLWNAIQMGDAEEASASRAQLQEYCIADVERTARLVLLERLRVPGCGQGVPSWYLPNACCGLASRLACVEYTNELLLKRLRRP
jgi:hypothetical protein